ncbi:DedA family protein [Kribbia dieselivorans]|uniref:DedA family protein n=1 Tax=Kribbia dieselivorans TaxID=331526 RepID=UPI000837F56D|nr:VTT domain-containing protein [Kribbia dieselivorans]
MLDAINTFVTTHADSPWALVAMFLLAVFDALLPPVPSESLVITLAAFGAATGAPNLIVLTLVVVVGAWCGDNLTYVLARRSGLQKVRHTARPRLKRSFAFAERELGRRGGSLIVAGRFIPTGRLAINVTAAAVGFPHRRFMGFSALGATSWTIYNVTLGALAGAWVHENPLLGALFGIVVAVGLALLVEWSVARYTAKGRRP